MLEKIMYWSGRTALEMYTEVMMDMDVVQHVPLPEGPKIIAANHPTTIDPFLILMLQQEQMSILITEMAFKVPVFGDYLRLAGHVPVVRNNGRAAFEEAIRLLEAGRTVAIFPEGSLSPEARVPGKARTGAARLSLITGAPVVPVGIHLQPERIRYVDTTVDDMFQVARWYLNGPYAMTAGKPMWFTGDVEDREHVVAVSQSIMRHITQLANESAYRLSEAPALDTGTFVRPVGLGNTG
jgi:1-acyl-sn-glycerol-3-phosphate acyltransferase